MRLLLLLLGTHGLSTQRAHASDISAVEEDPATKEDDTEEGAPAPRREPPLELVVEDEAHDPAADPTANRTVIDGETLRQSEAPTLLEAVASHTPGLHVTTTGTGLLGVGPGSSGGMSLRGLGGSPTTGILTVLDGMPVLQGLFGHPVPDFLTPGTVAQVAVTPGGDSVRYGSGALGGVVRMDSRWRELDGVDAQGAVSVGAFQTVRVQGGVWGRKGAWDGMTAADLLQTRGPRPGSGGQRWSAQTAGRWRGEQGLRVTVRGWGGRLQAADPGHIDRPTPEARVTADRAGVGLTLERPGRGTMLRVASWASGGDHRFADGSAVQDLNVGAYGERGQQLAPWLNAVAGVWTDARTGRRQQEARSQEDLALEGSVAAYGEVHLRPHETLLFLGGARLAWLDGRHLRVPFKGGLQWRPHPDVLVRLRHADNLRVPTLAERYLPLPVANPDLPPEAASTTEVSLGWSRPGGDARLAAFHTLGRDGIRVFGVPPFAERVAIDRIAVSGVEAAASARPLQWLGLRSHLTLHAPGRFTRQLPQRIAVGEIHAGYAGGYLSASIRHLGGLYDANYRRSPLPDTWALDGRASWTVPGWPLRITFLARNLLNRENPTLPGYPSAPRHGELRLEGWSRTRNPGPAHTDGTAARRR